MQQRLRLFEIGANLTDPVFTGIYRGKKKHENDLHEIIKRAKGSGVEYMLITGTTLSESKEALELISKYELQNTYSTVGCHPTRCNEMKNKEDSYINQLADLIKENRHIKAIGELGLDYDRLQFCDKEQQKLGFELQLKMAQQFQLPLFLHNRNTGDDFYNIMKKYRNQIHGGVVHSFTGTMDEMKKLIELDLYIGINGCSLKTKENVDVVKEIPLDKVLLETDCPWCCIKPSHYSHSFLKNDTIISQLKTFSVKHPQQDYPFPEYLFEKSYNVAKPEKWKPLSMVKDRTEPCHMVKVLCVVAAIKNIDILQVANAAFENSLKLFKIDNNKSD